MTNPAGALSDLRILDVSTEVAGPYCARVFAGYGADVIKIEPPGGDPARGFEPFLDDQPGLERSGFFAFLNTNKRGITLDLDTARGQELFRQLAAKVDIVIESFRPGYLDERGIGFAALEAVRPGIILTSITPYGQTGPWKDREGNDLTAFAVGLWAYINEQPGVSPLKGAGYTASCTAGTAGTDAIVGTMGALHYRDRHGVGQQVDVAIVEAVASLAAMPFVVDQYDSAPPRPRGQSQAGAGMIPVKDGFMALTLGLTHFYDQAWLEFGLTDVEEARQAWNEGRRAELMVRVAEAVKDRDKYDLFFKLAELQCPAGMALTTKDLRGDPHLRDRGFWLELDQPGLGHIELPGAPFQMSATPYALRRPAPRLGEHTAEVLNELLGFSLAQVAELAQAGIV